MKTLNARRPIVALAICVLALTGLAAACSDSGSKAASSSTQKGITVSDVWAHETTTATSNGSVYFTIENSTAIVDKLMSVSVPNSFAKSAQIHETTMSDSSTTMAMGESTSSTMAGSSETMKMQQVSSVTIPAGGTVTFAPGGFHVSLIGLAEPLKVGATFEVNLGFMNAGTIKVTATVRAD